MGIEREHAIAAQIEHEQAARRGDWYTLFQNKPLVDALLDRLQHHCITIRINGPSLRDPALASAPAANGNSTTSNKTAKRRSK